MRRKLSVRSSNLIFSLAIWIPTYSIAIENEAIKSKVQALAPGEHIEVAATPIKGLLEVIVGSEILYLSEDGRFMIQGGQLTDLDTRTNLTEVSKSKIRKLLLESIKSERLITYWSTIPKFDVLIFADIDDGYSRRMHSQISDYLEMGISIHYASFPRAGIGSNSFHKYVGVWCATDQLKAMNSAMEGKEVEIVECKNPIEDLYKLGRNLGVTGTPAIFLSNGSLIPGYLPPEKLLERLEAITELGFFFDRPASIFSSANQTKKSSTPSNATKATANRSSSKSGSARKSNNMPGAMIVGTTGGQYSTFMSALGKDISEAEQNWQLSCAAVDAGCKQPYVKCKTGGWYAILWGPTDFGVSCGFSNRDAAFNGAFQELRKHGDSEVEDCRVGFVDGRSHQYNPRNLQPYRAAKNFAEARDCVNQFNSSR